MPPRLQQRYKEEILPNLAQRLGRTNRLSLPRLEKIVINMGVGDAVSEKKHLQEAVDALGSIAGQKPIVTRARKSVAGFRLRQGMAIGCKVTLRRDRMYEFLERLLSFTIPRIRDFRGISDRSFDGRGNYTLGLSEQIIFPEVDYDKIDKVRGLEITIVTSTNKDQEAKLLLEELGMPFEKTKDKKQ